MLPFAELGVVEPADDRDDQALDEDGDDELVPVQAWFEIVRLWGPEVGLNPALMNTMLHEFKGVVKCQHFGAVIEREAFDSVVGRVVNGVPSWATTEEMLP